MRVNANAVLRSWTLLAAFGGSYAPAITYGTAAKQSEQMGNVEHLKASHCLHHNFCIYTLSHTFTCNYIISLYVFPSHDITHAGMHACTHTQKIKPIGLPQLKPATFTGGKSKRVVLPIFIFQAQAWSSDKAMFLNL